MPIKAIVERAGVWFLESGIQDPGGGVARYYRQDSNQNLPVSTEITGYAIGVLLYLHGLLGGDQYLDGALRAGHFLTRSAWVADTRSMPFECPDGDETASRYTYFFDCGIIIRGLLQLWGVTKQREFLDVAVACGRSLQIDFADGQGDFHPILRLPGKDPVARENRWSRSPGCYQLKSAAAWYRLWEETGEECFRKFYDTALDRALATWPSFLPGATEPQTVVDRLHPYCYFLEGMVPMLRDERCAAATREGLRVASEYVRTLAPEFERTDVYAQLLRARLYADLAGVEPLDRLAAEGEAQRLIEFAAQGLDNRVHGGFYFGRRKGAFLPHVSPVATAFGLQALSMWQQCQTGTARATHQSLI
jgi:hypothetical protein